MLTYIYDNPMGLNVLVVSQNLFTLVFLILFFVYVRSVRTNFQTPQLILFAEGDNCWSQKIYIYQDSTWEALSWVLYSKLRVASYWTTLLWFLLWSFEAMFKKRGHGSLGYEISCACNFWYALNMSSTWPPRVISFFFQNTSNFEQN